MFACGLCKAKGLQAHIWFASRSITRMEECGFKSNVYGMEFPSYKNISSIQSQPQEMEMKRHLERIPDTTYNT